MMKTIWTLAVCAVALVASPALARQAAHEGATEFEKAQVVYAQRLAAEDMDIGTDAEALLSEYRKLVGTRAVADKALRHFMADASAALSKLSVERRAAIYRDMLALRFDHDVVKRHDYLSWIGGETKDEALLAAQGWPCGGHEIVDADDMAADAWKARAIIREMSQWLAARASEHDCDEDRCVDVKHHGNAKAHCVDCDDATA